MSRSELIEKLQGKQMTVGVGGFVRLVDVMGSDAAVVQAARVSYGAGTKTVSDDRGLIRYLIRNKHTTPLEMCEIKLHVRVPMDTWRQWIRHRTASVNEYSTRYSEAIGEMHMSEGWRAQSTNNKQGSDGMISEWPEGYSTVPQYSKFWVVCPPDLAPDELDSACMFSNINELDEKPTPAEYLTAKEHEFHRRAEALYAERLKFGVAREQARKDLPLSTYTEAYWKIDLHNLLHFLGLRMDSHAQQEIREYAVMIGEQIVAPLFPLVWEAFKDYVLDGMTLSGIEVRALATAIDEMREVLDRDYGHVEDWVGMERLLDQSGIPEAWSHPDNRERGEFFEKASTLNMYKKRSVL